MLRGRGTGGDKAAEAIVDGFAVAEALNMNEVERSRGFDDEEETP